MLSDETYFCPACNATASPLEARTALYRCPHCSRGYLIARHPLPSIVRAVQPQGLAVEPDAQEAENSPPQSDESDVIRGRVHAPPTSLDEALWAALPGRRQARAQVMEADANTSPPPEESSSASAPTEPPSPKPKLHATPTVVLVLPPPYNEIDATAMEQMAATFSGLPSPVSLEIAGEQGQRRMLVRGAAAAVKSVVKQLYGVYRQVGAEILGPSEDPATTFDALNQFTIAAYLQPAGPEFLSLRTWREFEGNDPLNPLLGAFDGLGPSETALSQIILHGAAPERWAEPHLKQLVALKRRGYGAEVPAPTHQIVGFAGSTVVLIVSVLLGLWAYGDWHRWLVVAPVLLILALAAFGLFRLSGNPWAKTLDEEAAAKLRDPAFRIELRVFACAPTEARAREILDQVIAAYRLFNTTSGNQLRAVDPGQPLHPADLSPAEKIKPALLSVKEVAGLWHMPVGESLELVGRQTYECLLPLPRDVAHLDGALIGMSRKGDHEIRVHLSPEALQRNLFIIGKTQHGKSTFMEHVAAHWMRDPGRSVLIVDPHGDLARRVVGLVPPERVNDVVYIDLSDATQSVGLNLLDVSGGADPDDVAETFVDVGKALWQKYWGPRMLIPLGFGLRALAHANLRRPPERQYTILALATLLMCDSDVRAKFLRAEVPMDERPDVFRYFVGEYADGSAYQREQVISPVLSKAHAFERSAVIRRLVGQPRSTLSLFEAIRQHKIIILNTNSGVLGDDLAGFIGSLFLNVMRRVITRQTMLPRHERVQVSVAADEFQTMTGTDFGTLLGELQKNGGNFVLGTQSLDGLRRIDESGALTGMIFAGVATTVALRVNSEDARLLVEGELDVDRLRPESLVNLPPHVAYVKTIDGDGETIPVFSVEIALPRTPDARIIAEVLARRAAYTVSADEADRLSKFSLSAFDEEHQARAAKGDPESLGSEGRAAASVIENAQEPPRSAQRRAGRDDLAVSQAQAVISDQQRADNIAEDRPKADLPGWAAGFGNVSAALKKKRT
jgi:hypothetical protein